MKPKKPKTNLKQKYLWAESCEVLQVFCAQTALQLGLVSCFFCGEKKKRDTSVTSDVIQLDCLAAIWFTA